MGYISVINPDYYGEFLPNYCELVDQIVCTALQMMKTKQQGMFFSLLDLFAVNRRDIAERQKTVGASQFGLRRDSPEALKEEGALFVTYFMDMYREYGYRLLRQFAALPKEGRREKKESSFVWERATLQQLQERGWRQDCRKEVGEAYRNYYFAASDEKAVLYEQFLQRYRQNKYFSLLEEDEHTVYFIGSLFYNNTELTEYFVPIRSEIWQTPVVVHHDFFTIQGMLDELSGMFVECVESFNRERLALFSYLFSHTMPFCRGSAAIREWFELALYRHHGLTISYTSKRAIDLEALTSLTVDDFFDNYRNSFCKT